MAPGARGAFPLVARAPPAPRLRTVPPHHPRDTPPQTKDQSGTGFAAGEKKPFPATVYSGKSAAFFPTLPPPFLRPILQPISSFFLKTPTTHKELSMCGEGKVLKAPQSDHVEGPQELGGRGEEDREVAEPDPPRDLSGR